jgi:hypothetical protein
MTMKRAVLVMACTAFTAACGVESLVDVETTADSLEVAQTDYCTIRAEADQCRADFDACVLAAGADTEACRTALHACLPRPPRREGGQCADGGAGRPPPDGARPPLDGGRPPRHHGGPRGPHPEPEAVDACRTALADCLAATPGDATCLETERTCIRDAFRAAFDAACADPAAGCVNLPANAPADACTRLQQRCAEGVDGRHDADGGVCAAE